MRRQPATILIVEDEPGLALTLSDRLRAEGYAVRIARDGDEAVDAGTAAGVDAILLDIMLPGRDGFAVLATLRERGVKAPVIMLTARDPMDDKVAALRGGADDYVTKPFRAPELLARLEAVLRRARGTPLLADERLVRFGPWTMDLWEERALGPVPLELSPTESALLAYLIRQRGTTVPRHELLREVWRYAPTTTTRTVDQHVAQLRRKLEAVPGAGRHIVTVHGQGYAFRPD